MFQSKEIKHLFMIEGIFLSMALVGVLLLNFFFYQKYVENTLVLEKKIIANLITNHPELEKDIMESIINETGDIEKGDALLQKYGILSGQDLAKTSDMEKLKNEMILYNLLFFATVMLVSFLIYFFYRVREHKKIVGINQYIYQILNENYTLDIREYQEGDLSNLKNEIYKVTTKLKNMSELSLEGKRYLENTLSDISHQIRTPLTSMYVINDLLLDEEMNGKIRKEFLIKNKTQLERIEWLVTSLLKMSRLDSGSVPISLELVSIDTLIHQSLEPLLIPIELKNITIQKKIDPALSFPLDLKWTIEAFVNMIKNAYEHTSEGGEITISATENPLFLEITLTDTGEGIDSTDIHHIFERFYKGTHSKESIGIGLNLADKIVRKQNGVIEVESALGKGTTFHIKFYKQTF